MVLAVLALAASQAGCGGENTAGACERIAEACHDKDTGDGPAYECHELAEAGDANDDACAEQEQECTDVCAE